MSISNSEICPQLRPGLARRAGSAALVISVLSGGVLISFSGPASASSLKSEVPAAIRATGNLTDLVNSPYPPMEYQATTGGPIVGFDISIAGAVATALGLKLVVTNTTNFSELTPSVATGRTDIVASGTADFISREGSVHFVDYFESGVQFAGLKSMSASITTNAGLCGKTVVVQSGTSIGASVTQLSKSICHSGKQISVLLASGLPDQILQVKLGRAVALVQGPESNGYLGSTQPGKWHIIGKTFNAYFYGIQFSKKDPKLGIALRDALQSIINNGTYAKILAKWNLTGDGVTSATIDHGVKGS